MMNKPANLLLNGKLYQCQAGETVLEALLRQNVEVPFDCLKQTCLSCLMRSLTGTPPINSQRNLRETLQMQNKFLACACIPVRDMEIAFNQENSGTPVAEVIELNRLNRFVTELVLQCENAVDYHGGQSLLLLNQQRIGNRLSIASSAGAGAEGRIEIHVESGKGNTFSAALPAGSKIGDKLLASGIGGDMHYTAGTPAQPLLLCAWNSGLGALMGVVQDAFENRHSGPIYLFHTVSDRERAYFQAELNEIHQYFPDFHAFLCVRQGVAPEQAFQGDAERVIAQILPNLNGWKVFACGSVAQTHAIQHYAYLAGAAMKDIFLDVTSL